MSEVRLIKFKNYLDASYDVWINPAMVLCLQPHFARSSGEDTYFYVDKATRIFLHMADRYHVVHGTAEEVAAKLVHFVDRSK